MLDGPISRSPLRRLGLECLGSQCLVRCGRRSIFWLERLGAMGAKCLRGLVRFWCLECLRGWLGRLEGLRRGFGLVGLLNWRLGPELFLGLGLTSWRRRLERSRGWRFVVR